MPCSHCRGTGAKDGTEIETCPTCNGRGRVRKTMRTILGQVATEAACDDCQGTGKRIKMRCPHCNGQGIVLGDEVVDVSIPAGVATGMQICHKEKGHAPRRGGICGDLHVYIEEEDNPNFVRNENQLIYNLMIDFPTAALGGEVEVPLIEGTKTIRIAPGTQPDTIMRIVGEGLPTLHRSGRGDLLVNISIYVPEKLSGEEKEWIGKLRGREHFIPGGTILNKFKKKLKNMFQ